MSTFTCSPSCDDLADYCFILILTGRGQDVEQEEGFCHVSTEALSVMQHIFPLHGGCGRQSGQSSGLISHLSYSTTDRTPPGRPAPFPRHSFS